MDLRVNSVHFSADQKLIDFINEKIGKLEQFDNHLISGEVFLRLDNGSDKENKIAEIKLHGPGSEFFAKRQCKTFEEATDQAAEALRRQIQKNKR